MTEAPTSAASGPGISGHQNPGKIVITGKKPGIRGERAPRRDASHHIPYLVPFEVPKIRPDFGLTMAGREGNRPCPRGGSGWGVAQGASLFGLLLSRSLFGPEKQRLKLGPGRKSASAISDRGNLRNSISRGQQGVVAAYRRRNRGSGWKQGRALLRRSASSPDQCPPIGTSGSASGSMPATSSSRKRISSATALTSLPASKLRLRPAGICVSRVVRDRGSVAFAVRQDR
jgi:hypothetical protein